MFRRGGINMERKVGDVFTLDGKQFEVIKGFCADCDLFDFCNINSLRDIIGECYADFRNDNKNVCFKLVKEKE